MKPHKPNRRRLLDPQRGFALVITLSLMVLLTILAVGLLTMSTVSLRASGAGQARAEAQANARMALMMAIGELQTGMGPDQRVSARASSIDAGMAASDPNLLGAWKSWHWEPGSTGPNYGDKADGFQRWMASMRQPTAARSVGGAKSGFADPVWLIDPQTVGADRAGLRADRVPMELSKSQRGTFAWAVMDESMKAPFHLREPELEENSKDPTKGELMARRIAPPRARPEEILENLAPDQLGNPAKIVSLNTTVPAAKVKEEGMKVLAHQADLTPYSVGLLSDVARGGLKTDLTTLLETSAVGSANLKVDGRETVYNNAADGAPLWQYLRDHYQLHRKLGASASTGVPKYSPTTSDLRPESGVNAGLKAIVTKERLMPVISKLQIMFSAVTHYNHIDDRERYYNNEGVPKGNLNYGAPHLVYEPVVSLYNPYDVTLTLPKLRIRIWDPPVLFGFKKNADWLRPEFAQGEFHGLARFQIANEKNPDARRFFTLLLTEPGRSTPYGGPITMQPGEVRVFSPYVETQWTWGFETANEWAPRSFFDWESSKDFGNQDMRPPVDSMSQFGIRTVPGWDPRAGLQTDHLSYATRPVQTRYDFERRNPGGMDGGWLAIKLTDSFTVEAKPGRTVKATQYPDFEVDMLAGSIADVTKDILRTYKFRFGNPEAEISTTPAKPIISRTFLVEDLLQRPGDTKPEGKTPFALLTMAAKTTVDKNDYSAPWLHNHPVVDGVDQNTTRVGNALDSYDIRFESVTDFTKSPGIEFDKDTKKGYYGASLTADRGVSNVPMFRVPLLPAASLGELVPANLLPTAALPRVTHALGNSRAHPLLPAGSVTRSLSGGVVGSSGIMLDHSYLLNDALWDGFFFSTVANFSGNPLLSGMDRRTLLTEFLEGKTALLNSRLTPLPSGQGSLSDQAGALEASGEEGLSKRIASVLGIRGAFNVNSDSEEAWKALLSSLRDQQLLGWNMSDLAPKDKTGFSRFTLPIAGDGQGSGSPSIDVKGKVRWAGFRALTDTEIESLAQAIVKEIRARGAQDSAPSLTLGEFVNRRPGGASSLHALEGLLQRAINQSGINDAAHVEDSKKLGTVSSPALLNGMATPEARSGYDPKTGYSGEGAPSMLTQGDLLMALAPVITVRGDTFRIRAYGEAKDPDGKITAKAWCEAIVQRIPEYVDSADSPEVKPAALKSQLVNGRFGRRFNITSFRWLSPEEV